MYGKNGDIISKFSHNHFNLNLLNNKSFCLISYKDSEKIKKRFKNWNHYAFEQTYYMQSVGNYRENQKRRKELILYNYGLNQPNLI